MAVRVHTLHIYRRYGHNLDGGDVGMSYLNNHSVLHAVAREVEPGPGVTKLVDRMVEVMQQYDGAGLAAPQIGVSLRVIVFLHNGEVKAMINPVITRKYGDRKAKTEGCLSFPGQTAKVRRRECIEVSFQDDRGFGHSIRLRGKAARVVQHEIDHLDGITIV